MARGGQVLLLGLALLAVLAASAPAPAAAQEKVALKAEATAAEAAVAVEAAAEDDGLTQLRKECRYLALLLVEAKVAADAAESATDVEGREEEVKKTAEFYREVKTKHGIVLQNFVDKGGVASDCAADNTEMEALTKECVKVAQMSIDAEAAAEAAKAATETEGDKADWEAKVVYFRAVEAKHQALLKMVRDKGGDESACQVAKAENPELDSLRKECLNLAKMSAEAAAALKDKKAAAATEQDEVGVAQAAQYSKDVEEKFQYVRKLFVEKGGDESECKADAATPDPKAADREEVKQYCLKVAKESASAAATVKAKKDAIEEKGDASEEQKVDLDDSVKYYNEMEERRQQAIKKLVYYGGKESDCKVDAASPSPEDSAFAEVKKVCLESARKFSEAAAAVKAQREAVAEKGEASEEQNKDLAEAVSVYGEWEEKHTYNLKKFIAYGGKESDCQAEGTDIDTTPVPSPGTKDSSQVKNTIPCPKDPFEYCDFYIQGHKDRVPLLSLSKAHELAKGDVTATISDRIMIRNDKCMADENGCTVHIKDKRQTRFFCPAPEAKEDGYWPAAGDKFSSTSEGLSDYDAGSLQVFYNGGDEDKKDLEGRCAIMQFRTVYVFTKESGTERVVALDNSKDDPTKEYPVDRRCVVFKTGDEEPACNGEETDDPSCPAPEPISEKKDLFPLSKVDRALIAANCSDVKYPAYTQPCPIQGSCAFRRSEDASKCEGTPITAETKRGKVVTPSDCGKAVHIMMNKDYLQKCSEGNFLDGDKVDRPYYCAGAENNVPECNAMCKDKDWCTGWQLVVPNDPKENPKCYGNYKSQAGCSSDVVTPYYGGCGWCFLFKKDYCSPVCSKLGLDSTKAPDSRHAAYWAIHGRKCAEGKDDPHFVGADGTRFEFNGLPDQSFCLLSDERVHINMKMHGYFDDRLVGASVLKNGKAVRTWMRELGIMWKSEGPDGELLTHSLYLKARSGAQRERGDGFLASAKFDGQELLPLEAGSNKTFPSGLTIAFKGVEKYGPYDMDRYSVSLDGLIDLNLKLRLAHPLLQTPQDAEAHFNIMVETLQHTSQIHGVIGQTYRGGRAVRSLEYRALSALLGHAVAADGTSGLGYLDGKTQDYESSSVLDPDCKFSAFRN